MKKINKLLALSLALLTLASLCLLTSCTTAPAAGKDSAADTTAAENTQDTTQTSADSDYAYIKNKGKLIVGITEYEPMNYLDEAGAWTGFDTEFAQAVGEKLGVDIEFIVIDWDNKTFELESKSIDCVWNGMTLSDTVRSTMNCTNAYVINAQVVVMDAPKAADYKSADSLKDLRFAVESGSAGQDAADDASLIYTAVAAQSDALMEVAAGAADACIIDITMANAMTGEGTSYANLGVALSLTEEEYGIGFRQGSDMTEKLNTLMADMKADGTLAALAAKYSLTLAD